MIKIQAQPLTPQVFRGLLSVMPEEENYHHNGRYPWLIHALQVLLDHEQIEVTTPDLFTLWEALREPVGVYETGEDIQHDSF